MLENWRITKKLPVLMIVFALISAIATGVIAYSIASGELEAQAENQLRALLEARVDSVERYFTTVEEDVTLQAQSGLVVDAIRAFDASWDSLGTGQTEYLQGLYIDQNPFGIGQRDALLDAEDGSDFSAVHAQFHPQLRRVLESRDFYDVFLFNADGDLVYSVVKERDFATNMFDGQWSDTHLADVVRGIDQSFAAERTVFADFERYAPSDGDPASFLGAPVFDDNRQYIGAFAVQMPVDKLNEVMQVTAGMGETGETYLVGEDRLMRSDSRFLATSSILEVEADTVAVGRALLGQNGVDVIDDYRGIPVFSAYSAIDFGGVRWAVLAEIDEGEVLEPTNLLFRLLLVSGLIVGLSILVVGIWLAGTLSKPIVAMTATMKRLANDDMSTNVSVNDRGDEIGDMARAMVVFKQNAMEKRELQRELKFLAEHDELTGLLGRTAFLEKAKNALHLAHSVDRQGAVLYIDVDDFKPINDFLGHATGDELLRLIAQVLTNASPPASVVGRVGGDEFVVLLPYIPNAERAREVAHELLESIRQATSLQERFEGCEVSIGVAVYPDEADEVDEIIDLADKAMYHAKSLGKGQVSRAISALFPEDSRLV